MRKAFSFTEIIVYTVILAFVAIYVGIISKNFVQTLQVNQKIEKIAKDYDTFLLMLQKYSTYGYVFDANSSNGAILKKDSDYIGVGCDDGGMYFTNISDSLENIDWDNPAFSTQDIECFELSGRNVTSGYWIGLDIRMLSNDLKLKYLFVQ